MPYTLKAIPCRTDNYVWIIHNTTHACVVDPSLAAPVQDYIVQHNLILADILITHHHHDHVEGIAGLLPLLVGDVIGDSKRISAITKQLNAPETFTLSHSNISVGILPTYGHTYDHVSYILNDVFERPVLFCGDTVFSGGCGRLFDGKIEQLFDSFLRLMQLSDDTQIACAHEYTLDNLAYALAIDSSHSATQALNNKVKYARARGEPSLPTTLAIEKQINPYMRCINFDAAWVELLTKFALRRGELNVNIQTPLDAFTLCRKLKNQF